MSKILIIYSTTDGHTLRICERLRGILSAGAHDVTLVPVAEATDGQLGDYDKVVVGASIRYGRHSPLVVDYIERNAQALNAMASAFFSVNIVARKPGKNEPHANPYSRKPLRRIAWRPREVAVFAGKLNYPIYGALDRMIIRFIMLLTGGPTDPTTVVEFTDWGGVDAFGAVIARM